MVRSAEIGPSPNVTCRGRGTDHTVGETTVSYETTVS